MKYAVLTFLIAIAMVGAAGESGMAYAQQTPKKTEKNGELIDCGEITPQVTGWDLPKPLESFILTAIGCS